jgi:hypothetical protein
VVTETGEEARHMRLARYASLLEQRERVLAKITAQIYSRRRIAGNSIMHMCDLSSATRTDAE